jgi:hypothetical protein
VISVIEHNVDMKGVLDYLNKASKEYLGSDLSINFVEHSNDVKSSLKLLVVMMTGRLKTDELEIVEAMKKGMSHQ